MRRCPIYLLLDCSESMAGTTFKLMKSKINDLISELLNDPYAAEMAYISVITFGSRATQVTPLTEIFDFQCPKLVLSSGTALGAAITLLKNCIEREVVKSTPEQKGDYKPMVFIMTDGEPTDEWQKQAEWLRQNRHLFCVATGIGSDVNMATLRQLSEKAVHMKDGSEESFSSFFEWVSCSIATSSRSAGGDFDGLDLGELKANDDFEIVDENTADNIVVPNRLIFLHAQCRNHKKYYLMKYEKSGNVYNYVESIPVEDFDFSTAGSNLTVANDSLRGCAICPYCGDTTWGHCSCGKIFCQSSGPGTYTCPWCGDTSYYSPGSFDLDGGAG